MEWNFNEIFDSFTNIFNIHKNEAHQVGLTIEFHSVRGKIDRFGMFQIEHNCAPSLVVVDINAISCSSLAHFIRIHFNQLFQFILLQLYQTDGHFFQHNSKTASVIILLCQFYHSE